MVPPPSLPQCTGRAAEALAVFRAREKELKSTGQAKPDMVAYKELHGKWTPIKEHGQIPGVPVGLQLHGRGEAAILGIHTQIPRGIDSEQGECYAVCFSGKYVDDVDAGSDGTLVYTGCGGQKKGIQVADQKNEGGNAALIQSMDTELPIRLLRRHVRKGCNPEYFYDGLYQCTGYTYEPSKDGPKVYKFDLVPIEGESKRSTIVESSRSPSAHKPRLVLKRKKETSSTDEQHQRALARKPQVDW